MRMIPYESMSTPDTDVPRRGALCDVHKIFTSVFFSGAGRELSVITGSSTGEACVAGFSDGRGEVGVVGEGGETGVTFFGGVIVITGNFFFLITVDVALKEGKRLSSVEVETISLGLNSGTA